MILLLSFFLCSIGEPVIGHLHRLEVLRAVGLNNKHLKDHALTPHTLKLDPSRMFTVLSVAATVRVLKPENLVSE